MGAENIIEKIKKGIAFISFNIFLWAVGMTEESYFKSIYEQEQALKESK